MNVSEMNKLKSELLDAVRNSNLDGVTEALKKGASADNELAGMPLVLYAAQRELWDILDELYVSGADLNAKYEVANWTLLHQLCATNRIDEVKNYLPDIDNGYEREKSAGKNAMMICIEKGHREIFELLVEKKLEFRQLDNDGNNSFHYLAKAGWVDLIEKYGVNPIYSGLLTAKNKDGDTVLGLSGLKMIDIIKEAEEETIVESKENEKVDNVEVEVEVVKPKLGKLKGARRL